MNQESPKTIHTVRIVCCLLAVAVAIVFGQTVRHDFVNYDDQAYVYENPQVSQGLTPKTVTWSFTAYCAGNWHPLTLLSHALDCQLYGTENAAGHHLTNVVLHAAVVILLFLILWRMTGNLWPSAFVAAVFAVHPLRVESVAWVAERKDVLSGLFFMLTLAAYLNYVRHPFSRARYLLVAVLFALGLMAKPMLVTLPFVLLLLDYWPLGRLTATAGTGNVPPDGSSSPEPPPALGLKPLCRSPAFFGFSARRRREDPAACADGGLLRGHVAGPARRHGRPRYCAALLADRQRLGRLRRLYRAILLSGRTGGALSLSV